MTLAEISFFSLSSWLVFFSKTITKRELTTIRGYIKTKPLSWHLALRSEAYRRWIVSHQHHWPDRIMHGQPELVNVLGTLGNYDWTPTRIVQWINRLLDDGESGAIPAVTVRNEMFRWHLTETRLNGFVRQILAEEQQQRQLDSKQLYSFIDAALHSPWVGEDSSEDHDWRLLLFDAIAKLDHQQVQDLVSGLADDYSCFDAGMNIAAILGVRYTDDAYWNAKAMETYHRDRNVVFNQVDSVLADAHVSLPTDLVRLAIGYYC